MEDNREVGELVKVSNACEKQILELKQRVDWPKMKKPGTGVAGNALLIWLILDPYFFTCSARATSARSVVPTASPSEMPRWQCLFLSPASWQPRTLS